MDCYGFYAPAAWKAWASKLSPESLILAELKFSGGSATFIALYQWNQIARGEIRYLLGQLVKTGLLTKKVVTGTWYDDETGQKSVCLYRLTEEGKRVAPVAYS